MEQSPSGEANRFSTSQEISSNLWNQEVYYRIYKCPPATPILSRPHPIAQFTVKALERVDIHLSKSFSNKMYSIMISKKILIKSNYIPTYFGSDHHHHHHQGNCSL